MPVVPAAGKFRTVARIRMRTQKDALFISDVPEMDKDGLPRKMAVIECIAQTFIVQGLSLFQGLGQVLVSK